MQTTTAFTTAWPAGVIARYLTVAGAALGRDDLTVDVETLTTVDYDDPLRCRGRPSAGLAGRRPQLGPGPRRDLPRPAPPRLTRPPPRPGPHPAGPAPFRPGAAP
ncbi:hypothetical protein [Streptomyces sp. NRRL WC-3719]|uniref:hypothetical protein n=1 Tax=Streptomyces sp. NRRL WC-3719 TaxID=1463932 RepID=UPI0004CDC6EA|nr:hypothetical protein [Streptomyces sp. NRRL WC-3719]